MQKQFDMTREEFKQSLLQSATNEARRRNYRLTSDVATNLKELIDSGVERMTSSEFISESRRQEAERNLNRLVEYMVSNAKSRNLSESVDIRAFSSVRMSICPLWPFC